MAALRPRMLELAAELTHGAHTYFVPPVHTARARAILGPTDRGAGATGALTSFQSSSAPNATGTQSPIGVLMVIS